MASMKVEVDMSELEAATAKAERLCALLDGIEARFTSLPPDMVMMALAELAESHGYGIVSLELQGRKLVGAILPRHEYKHG